MIIRLCIDTLQPSLHSYCSLFHDYSCWIYGSCTCGPSAGFEFLTSCRTSLCAAYNLLVGFQLALNPLKHEFHTGKRNHHQSCLWALRRTLMLSVGVRSLTPLTIWTQFWFWRIITSLQNRLACLRNIVM